MARAMDEEGPSPKVNVNSEEHCNGAMVRNDPCLVDTAVAYDNSSLRAHQSSQQARCCHCRCLFPDVPASEYKKMFRELCFLSWPMMLYLVTSHLLSVTSIIFTGHLGKDEIVAASLGQSVIHVFWRAFIVGFACGADTLFTQTFGSTNKKRVGIFLQRFFAMSMLMAIFCCGILLNTEGILLLFGQVPRIAKLSGAYGMTFIAATPADVVVVLLVKYLESQGIVRPILVITVIMGGMNILFHFVMVTALQYGLVGAVGAQVITYYLGAIMITGFIYKTRIYELTWPGWSWECLQEWGTILKVSIGGLGINAIEWWSFEAGFFIAGLYGITEVGAHAILFNITAVTWCLSTGVGIGASILIGNNLGAKNPTKARITTCLALIITVILSIVYITVYWPLKDVIGYIFTKETDVVELAASIIPIIAITEIFDSSNTSLFGVLRGCGYQHIGAVTCLIGQGTGLAIGVPLMFKYDQGLKGLWFGMLAALSIEFLILIVFILCFINWDREVIKAQKRAAVLPKSSEMDCKCDGDIPLESMGNAVDEEAVWVARDEGERNSIRDGESQVCRNDDRSHDLESKSQGSSEGEQSGFLQQELENTQESGHTEEETRLNSCSSNDEKQNEGRLEEVATSEIVVLTLDRLSPTHLVLRRGLLLLFIFLFLLASVYVAIYVVPTHRPPFQESANATANYTADYTDGSLGNGTYTIGRFIAGSLTDLTTFN